MSINASYAPWFGYEFISFLHIFVDHYRIDSIMPTMKTVVLMGFLIIVVLWI